MPKRARESVKGQDKAGPRREVLNLQQYATFFFTVLANKLASGASRLYLKRFGIGIIEWRILAMLAVEPGINPARITQVIGIDKAAVSRESRRLQDKGLMQSEEEADNGRRRKLSLTEAGYQLHDEMLQVALERERRLLSDLSEEEITVLLDLLARTTARIPYVNEYDPASTAAVTTRIGRRRNTQTR
jgi:DNA-binding MarR family transcriptional regulator